jgi:hypothetical protein
MIHGVAQHGESFIPVRHFCVAWSYGNQGVVVDQDQDNPKFE